MPSSLTAVVLAAGKGTRMKSNRAKVLHELFFRPMLHHVLDAVAASGVNHTVVIVGHQHERVRQAIAGYPVATVLQEEQLGTGHAVLCARQACETADQVLILCGDTPLIRPETLQEFIHHHHASGATVSLMTTLLDDPFGYGRILSDETGRISAIVEEKDASAEQRKIRQINAGIYLAEQDFLFHALEQVGTDNSQGEVYLTDIIAIANREGKTVSGFVHPHPMDVLGVNSRVELAQAHDELKMRYNRKVMLEGVTMYTPQSILVAPETAIGKDTILHQNTVITGATRIGAEAVIETGCLLHDCVLGDRVVIGANSVLINAEIENGEHIPPLTHRVA